MITMKKMFDTVGRILILCLLVALPCTITEGKTKNQLACEAYMKGLEDGTIKYEEYNEYGLFDLNSDGIKELVSYGEVDFTAWTNVNGTLKQFFCDEDAGVLSNVWYDNSNKWIWTFGEGDGGYYHGFEVSDGKLVEKECYYSYGSDDGIVYGKRINGEKQSITEEEYEKAADTIRKYSIVSTKSLSKAELILSLQKEAGSEPGQTQKQKNKSLDLLYKNLVEDRLVGSSHVYYKFADITFDGLHEALIEHHPLEGGSGRIFEIFTCQGGEIKTMLKTDEYGLNEIEVYKKSKGFVMGCAGHGAESYWYYKKNGMTYSLVATKGRQNIGGDLGDPGPWGYENGKGEKISKSKFVSLTKPITKGKKRKLDLGKWTYVSGTD